MYMSRVELDVNNRRKIRDLSHAGAYHSWVESSFPDELANGTRSRKLWRLDNIQGRRYLIVVSPDKPDLNALEKYGVSGSAVTKDYDPFLDAIHSDRLYQFRAVLNPVHSVCDSDGKRGRVFPEVTAAQQLEYFRKRSATNGFELMPGKYEIKERKYVTLNKAGQKPLRLCQCAYEGILKVSDEDRFKYVLCHGIGRKKAYGFGLMTVIPIDE